jgi:hypothetical protein
MDFITVSFVIPGGISLGFLDICSRPNCVYHVNETDATEEEKKIPPGA